MTLIFSFLFFYGLEKATKYWPAGRTTGENQILTVSGDIFLPPFTETHPASYAVGTMGILISIRQYSY